MKKGELLYFEVTLLGEAHGSRGLADQPLIRQVLARRGDAADIESPLEVILELGTRGRLVVRFTFAGGRLLHKGDGRVGASCVADRSRPCRGWPIWSGERLRSL